MSRTHKDRPFFVRLREKMEKGEYDHQHHRYMGSGSYTVSHRVDFFKKDAKEINDFRNFLIEEGVEFETEELEALHTPSIVNNQAVLVEIMPKKIRFRYKQKAENKWAHSDYCTDLEHYDPHTQTDTRDGKRASCLPFAVDYRGCNCSLCSPEKKTYKNKRNASLNDIAKAYNNGHDYDELYNFDDISLDVD